MVNWEGDNLSHNLEGDCRPPAHASTNPILGRKILLSPCALLMAAFGVDVGVWLLGTGSVQCTKRPVGATVSQKMD